MFATTRRVQPVACELVYASKRRDIELSGRSASGAELDQMTAYLTARTLEPAASWTVYIEFLTFLMRLQEHDRIREVFASLPPIPVKKLGINRRIALIKLLRNDPFLQKALNVTPAELYAGLVAFQRLKLNILSATEAMFESNPWTHREVEQRFHELASVGVKKEFEDIYLPFYHRVRQQLAYMDLRWSLTQRQEFYTLVTQRLRDRQPFALLRLSDREAYMFAESSGQYFTQADVENCERHWWRLSLTLTERSRLTKLMREASDQADVLGIPSIYRLLRELDAKSKSMLTSLQVRGLAEVVHFLNRRPPSNQVYTEEKSNIPLFMDFENMRPLFDSAQRVVLIASASESTVKSLFNSITELKYIAIPHTHAQ